MGKILLTGKKYLIYSTYSCIGFILLCAFLSQIITQFIIWPLLPNYRQEINNFLSKSVQSQVEIGEIKTFWQGFRPGFILKNVSIANPNGFPEPVRNWLRCQSALEIPQIEGIINWNTLWELSPHFQYLTSQGAKVYIARNLEGVWDFAGIIAHPTGKDSNILSWIMKENHLFIQDLFLEVNDQFEDPSHFSCAY
jgi:uncharacterized protein YhdP